MSSEDTPKNAVVTIGASKDENGDFIQRQDAPGDRSHIAGNPYPMYGSRKDVARSANPRVKMRHLSALVALKIVNQGDGTRDNGDMPITVRTIELEATSDIVGEFTVNFAGDNVSFTSKNAGKIAKLELAESVTIEPGDDATFYLAVKPFDASGKDLTVRINGSARKVKMPSDANISNFLSGQMKTLRVPVKLSYPKESDAVTGTPAFVTMVSNTTNPNLIYNGETVSAYIVGTSGANDGNLGGQGKIKVSGSTTELLNALDAGFYASTWKGKPAAMTVTNLMLYFSDSAGEYTVPFIKHDPFLYAIGVELEDELLGLDPKYSGTLIQLVLDVLGLDNGIPRQGGMINLTKFIHPSTITFNRIISNNVESASDPILILDEEPIFKELGSAAINYLLKEKFTYNGKVPTAQGLKDIVNETEGSSDANDTEGSSDANANDTAEAIYYSLKDVLSTNGDISTTVKILFFSVPVDMNLGIVFDELIAQYNSTDPIEGLKELLRDMKFEIEIGSYPYAANKLTAYGTKGEPVVPKEYGCNPIVFWGLSKGLSLN